jgi:purine nucleosidase
MLGLDVTLRTGAGPAILAMMSELGRLGTELLRPALEQYRTTAEPGGPAVHDVCALVYVADPGLFGLVPASVEVETAGRLTSGMTVTDFEAADHNVLVATSIDVARFWDLTLSTYADLAARMTAATR